MFNFIIASFFGYHEPWRKYALKKNGLIVLYMDYPDGGYLNLFKLAITVATFSLKLKRKATLIRKSFSLPLFLDNLLNSYSIRILLERLYTDTPFGYRLYVFLKK